MSKRKCIGIVAFLLIISNFLNCKVHEGEPGRKQLFDLNWKFNYGDDRAASEIDFNDKDWRSIDLPHDWSKDNSLLKRVFTDETDSTFVYVGWYRKHFDIPQNWAERKILIDFEGISDQHEIFVNGISIADSSKEKTSFQTTLNPYLNSTGNNVVAIRITTTKQSKEKMQSESGIFNHVWLVIKDPSEFKK